ncbi:MAG: 30S ribosomal protein S9 [Candidatus Magasanikbacteria bacterium]|nr:30S ribosomal protein S9 [Candidatus Magasanikbacteria bacterium]
MVRSVGRRKTAAARVRIMPGNGAFTVNGKPMAEYFPYFEWQNIVMAPLVATSKEKTFDVSAKISGGGKKGQAVSVRHGVARALVLWNEDLKKTLKTQGYLTRDARVKERKKPGLKSARRAPQWSKR